MRAQGEGSLEQRLRILQEIGVAVGSTLELQDLLRLIVDRVSSVMQAERSTLYLLDAQRGELWSTIAQGENMQEIRMPVGSGLAGWVARTGEALCIEDVYLDARFDRAWDQRTGFRTRSALCLAVHNQRGERLGVLQVLNRQQGSFSADDQQLLAALAAQVAVAIDNARLVGDLRQANAELLRTQALLQRRVQEQQWLTRIAEGTGLAGGWQEMLDALLEHCAMALQAEAVALWLPGDRGAELRFRRASNGIPGSSQVLQVPLASGTGSWVALHGEPILRGAGEAAGPGLDESLPCQVRGTLCVPLAWEAGQGALQWLNKQPAPADFDEDDLRFAKLIAAQVSAAIGMAQSRQQRARDERLALIGQFLSGMLHDLKTPMTVISGFVQLLVPETEPEQRAAYARTVQRQVQLINTMTRETLAFARGDRTLWVRKVYLHQFFGDLCDQLRIELAARNIRLQLQLDDRGVAYLDEHKLIRAVHNLARNAADAMGRQGGQFRIQVARDADGSLLLRFEDDGPGIPQDIQARIFESFATHGKRDGTGLGLAVVHKVVADHGGRIRFDSQPGCTVFSLWLPQPPEGAALVRESLGSVP